MFGALQILAVHEIAASLRGRVGDRHCALSKYQERGREWRTARTRRGVEDCDEGSCDARAKSPQSRPISAQTKIEPFPRPLAGKSGQGFALHRARSTRSQARRRAIPRLPRVVIDIRLSYITTCTMQAKASGSAAKRQAAQGINPILSISRRHSLAEGRATRKKSHSQLNRRW